MLPIETSVSVGSIAFISNRGVGDYSCVPRFLMNLPTIWFRPLYEVL